MFATLPRLLRRHVAFAATAAFVMLVACNDDDTTCNGEGQCSCDESCSKSCTAEGERGCEFVCRTGTCSFDCPGGDCRVSCGGDSSCNVACPKGGCTVSGGRGKTDVNCGGLGTCTVGCTGDPASCLVDGKPAVGAEGATDTPPSGTTDQVPGDTNGAPTGGDAEEEEDDWGTGDDE